MNFEQYAGEANKFLQEIAHELGNPEDTDHAYRVMVAVFHALREVITPEESLHLIAQFPMIIKAVYINGWHAGAKRRIRSMEEFLNFQRAELGSSAARDLGSDELAKQKVRAVLNVVRKHVSAGEVNNIITQFPSDLAELWAPEEETV